MRLLEDVDRLLMTRPELTLGEHVRQANAYACSDKDRQNFELNELYMLTLWGPRAPRSSMTTHGKNGAA